MSATLNKTRNKQEIIKNTFKQIHKPRPERVLHCTDNLPFREIKNKPI